LSLANQGFGFLQKFCSIKFGVFSGGDFQNFIGFKIGSCFCSKSFGSNFLRSLKSASRFQAKFWQAIGFILQSPFFHGLHFFLQSQVFKIGFKVFRKIFGKFGSGFFARFVFSGKANFSQSQFLAKVLASSRLLCFGKSVCFPKIKSGL